MSLPGAAALRDAVVRGEVRAVDVIEAALARTDLLIGADGIGAFLSVQAAAARREAAAVDGRVAEGEHPAMAGVPVALSDEIGDAGHPLTGACALLRGRVAAQTAPAVARFPDARGLVLGRTNLDALGLGASTEASGFHTTLNPWDVDRVSGGRGGAAAAVATGALPMALCSDVGGGLRQAAAWCGVAALRPTPDGEASAEVLSLAPAHAVVGAIAGSVRDLDRVAGLLTTELGDQAGGRPDGADGVVVGIVMETMGRATAGPVKVRVNDALAALEAQGARLRPVSAPSLLHAAQALADLVAIDVLDRHADHEALADGGDAALDRTLRRARFLVDRSTGQRQLATSRTLAARIGEELRGLLDQVDVLATPTTTDVAFRFGEHTDDPDAAWSTLAMTAGPSLAGLPALSVPAGLADLGLGDRMPVGLQLIAAPHADRLLLDLGCRLQGALDPTPPPPKLRW